MKMIVGVVTVALAIATSAFGDRGDAPHYELYRAYLKLDHSISPEDGLVYDGRENHSFWGDTAGSSAVGFDVLDKYKAHIYIMEMDHKTFAQRITRLPVIVTTRSRGLIARANWLIGKRTIYGLKDKSLNQVLGKYSGAQIALSAILTIGGSSLGSSRGVRIGDIENIFAGLGLKAAYVEMVIALEGKATFVNVVQKKGQDILRSDEPIKQVLNRVYR